MKSTKAANRYASSLLSLAKEQKQLDKVRNDMVLVQTVVEENRDLEIMLASPIIKAEAKGKVLDSIFSASITKLSMQFLSLLVTKGREPMLGQIAGAFIDQYRIENGIINAKVISAVPLSDAWKKALIESLASTGNSIDLNEEVDPSILGGLRIKVGDQLIDASVRRKLNELKQEISQQKLSAI